jgi:hypothetical protein
MQNLHVCVLLLSLSLLQDAVVGASQIKGNESAARAFPKT